MIRKLVVLSSTVIAAFAAFVAMQPSHYRIERSTTIARPAAEIFPHVTDFRRWQAWSPWAKVDPNAKATFEGAESGRGAVFKWSGNDDVGEGSMTILDARPNESVAIKLAFTKPFESSADVAFSLQPVGDKTTVTWSIAGENGFVARALCLLMGGMDAMVGADYEKGLANLKAVVEGST